MLHSRPLLLLVMLIRYRIDPAGNVSSLQTHIAPHSDEATITIRFFVTLKSWIPVFKFWGHQRAARPRVFKRLQDGVQFIFKLSPMDTCAAQRSEGPSS